MQTSLSRGIELQKNETETYHTSSPSETEQIGALLSAKLGPGEVWFLIGDLGAGKTTFVAGLLRALGVADHVRSPSYNLIHEYDLQFPVAHIDLYRLKPGEFESIGLEDYLGKHAILIEWPERLEMNLTPTKTIRFEIENGRRSITVT